MKALLVQLSDIHLRENRINPAMDHAPLITQALQNVDYGLDLCVLVLSGDVAFAGQESEYLLAAELVGALQDGLHQALNGNPEVVIVGVPGNHDCVLIPEPRARTYTIDGLLSNERPEIDANVITECTDVQRHFFQFMELVNGDLKGDRLAYRHQFQKRGDILEFHCYNTAWLSRIPENQGDLYFPVDRVLAPLASSRVVVTLFHHPYHWLRQGNYREFRKRVEEVSDLVLTGHEHEGEQRRTSSPAGTSLYVEGAALQPHQAREVPGFNAVMIDTTERTQRVLRFEWAGERYSDKQVDSAGWEPFRIPLRRSGVFDLLEDTERWLDDLELAIQHPTVGTLKLSNLFVPLDLEFVSPHALNASRLIRGEDLASEVLKLKHVLITGSEKIGKTAVAKNLFRTLYEAGMIPLFVNARIEQIRSNRINDFLSALCERQYGSKAVEAYSQLDRSRRVLIVDEGHRLHVRGESVSAVLNSLCLAAEYVVVFTNDMVHALVEATQGGPEGVGTAHFEYMRLQEMGHERRHELAERWFSLDPVIRTQPSEMARKLVEAKRMIDTTVGFSFVPAIPVFLIPILQAYDTNQALDLSASTYGYFYELLIKSSLLKDSPTRDMDVRLAYLTHLASAMFRRGVEEVSEDELHDIHREYQEERLVELRFTHTLDDLVRRGVLSDVGGLYKFRYRYIRYYFTARHLAETISTDQTQSDLQRLTESLHFDEEANVLLFLAHLSRDRSIIDGMLRQAERVFEGVTRAELKGTSSHGAESEHGLELEVSDAPVVDRQRALMRALDDRGSEADENTALDAPRQGTPAYADVEDEPLQEEMDLLFELTQRFAGAYRTLQILGQTVKNFPGSMKGHEKMQVVDAAYGVGLRTLAALLELIRLNEREIQSVIADAIRAEDHLALEADIVRKAQQTLHGMAHMVCYGLVRRIAAAVGSRDLDPVYDRLLKQNPTPAMEAVRIAIHLEQFSETLPMSEIQRLANAFENKHPRAYEVLRHSVYAYLQLFEVGYAEKQTVCNRLSISYPKIVAINPERKLLRKTFVAE